MKRRNLWILLAVLAVAAILVFALLGLRGGEEEKKPENPAETPAESPAETSEPSPEPTPVDSELPMDETPLVPDDSEPEEAEQQPAGEEKPEGEEKPADGQNDQEDPADSPGQVIDPEEDELPLMP